MIDLLVAGGGPAGLATALHAARAGLEVTVVEPRAAPIDKACGEGLLPPAVARLGELGVQPPGVPLHGIRYLQGAASVDAPFRAGPGLGVRRTALHRTLHAAAAAAGVGFVTGRVTGFAQDAGSVVAAGLRARYLVGADGLHSRVRRLAGLQGPPDAAGRRRWGVRAHLAIPPWTDHVEVYWSPAAEAYVTPVAADCVGVAVLGGRGGEFAERLAGFGDLAARLHGARTGPVLAAGPLRQRVPARVSGRVLLVGDAAGYVDALTGEGLALAFGCARALVARVAAGEPERYERDYAALSLRYRAVTSVLLAASRRPSVRARLVPAAARLPWLFRSVVDQLAT